MIREMEHHARARCLESTTWRAIRATHIATRRNEGERREAIERTLSRRKTVAAMTSRRVSESSMNKRNEKTKQLYECARV